MKGKIKLGSILVVLLALSACEGGKTQAQNAEDAKGCVKGVRVSNGAEYTNSCDFSVNVAVFDPLYRFTLEPGQTQFLARTSNLTYAVCDAPAKPKERDGGFFCD